MRLEGEKLGHYQLTRFIQSGGMGEVYLAEDLTLSREVAIKVMKTEPVRYPDAQSSKDAARLFQREMQAISMLDHAHILTLHEAGEQQIGRDNITYMVMPYCPEGSLSDWIHHYHSTQPLSPNKVAQILQQAADALQYAHDKKILHLDVKPSNFLVRRQQDPSQLPNLLLADFGVAKIATTSKLSGTVRGTLEYMAPEQVEGAPVAASDQYALGIMVYELLTGRTPYQGALPHVIPYMRNKVDPEPPSTVNPSLPSALDKVVLQALAKKPQDRFASVKEFASAFAAMLKPKTLPAPDPKKPSSPKVSLPEQSYLQALGSGVVAAVLIIITTLLSVEIPYTAYNVLSNYIVYIIYIPSSSHAIPFIVILFLLFGAGSVTGKVTGQRRLGWLSGITAVTIFTVVGPILIPEFMDLPPWFIYLKYYLTNFIPMVFITAPICGFGGAWLATRKQRPSPKSRSRKYRYLWTIICGIIAGLIIIRISLAYTTAILWLLVHELSILLILCVAGLVVGKVTKEPRMGWISGITTIIIFTVFILFRGPLLSYILINLVMIAILAGICSFISFGGAWFATRKSHK